MGNNQNNQNKPKTLLAKQKLIILILGGLIILIAALCIILPKVFTEELQTVYAINDKGDYVVSTVKDSTGLVISMSTLENQANGTEKNKWNVKKGETDNILYTFNLDGVTITERPFIFKEIPAEEIDRVTVTNESGTISVYSYEGSYIIEGAERNLYNQQALAELLFQARYMLAVQYVDKTSDYADYGLVEGKYLATVTVTDKSGSSITVYIGSEVMEGSGYYMKHAEKDYIYIMDSTASVFLNDITSYLSPVVIEPIEEHQRNYIEKFALAKNGVPFFACRILTEEEQKGVYANQLHKMTYPEPAHVLNTLSLYDMFGQVGGLSGVAVVEYGISGMENAEEVLAAYGLNEPVANITFAYAGKDYSINVGGLMEIGGMYYYCVYSEYQDTIVLVLPDNLAFLQYNLEDFYQPQVFQYNIKEIASVEAKYADKVCNYVLEGDGDALKVTETNTSKIIDTQSFRQFYKSLMFVTIGGYSSLEGASADTLKHELTFTVTFKDSSKLVYEFYSESTMNCYMIEDGKGGFKTERRLIEDIVNKSEMLMNGEIIESDV